VTTEPPGGHRWRRPTLDDAEAIYELVARRNTAVVGFADTTLADVRDGLTEPGFDPAVDGWLVHDDVGAVATIASVSTSASTRPMPSSRAGPGLGA
jgi:hypothetical protein